MIGIFKLKPCESCNGTQLQIQNSGALRGMIRICPDCCGSWSKAANQYGTDSAEHPEVYIDLTKDAIQKVDKRKDYILINGKDIPIIPNKTMYGQRKRDNKTSDGRQGLRLHNGGNR